ncbi:hypothetical protein AAC387_Pa03g2073 [Persea americana]
MHIRVRYQYHPRGSAPLFKGSTALSSVLHQPGRHSHTHIRVRYQYHPRGSAPLFRGPTALSSVPAPARAAQPYAHQGPVPVPPSRLGASVQRANRSQLGACTSQGGTAICTLGSSTSTTLAARRLCSERQPPSARCLHQPGRHSHMHIRVRYQYHPRGSAPLFRGPTALSSVPAPAWAAKPYAHQGPVAIRPSRFGASVQRADRPQLVPVKLLGKLPVSTSIPPRTRHKSCTKHVERMLFYYVRTCRNTM